MKEKRKIKSYIFTIIITMIVSVAGTIFVLQANFNIKQKEEKTSIISNTILEEKLSQIDQWSTSELKYNGTFSETNPRMVFGQRVPFADNKIEIEYEGVIKVGYALGSIKTEVNNTTKVITVKLSSPEVFDNYIILDTLKIKEENNILNPIHVSDLPTYFDSIKSDELTKAEKEQNIYALAEKKAKETISDKLAVFKDYKVSFA
jgi:hypothetical protein